MKNTIIIMLTALLWISCSDDEKVNIKPVAAFKTSEVTIEEGQHVAFTDLSFDEDGQVTKWAWDFGNGVSSEEQSPTVEYTTAGEYTVTLSVWDNLGVQNANTFNKTITVKEKSTADKQDKLKLADRQLSDLKENMDAIQERTEHLKEEAYKYSRDVHSKVDSLLKDAMLENMVNEFRDLSARMTGPERQMFDGTLVQSIAEQGKEVMHCATLLFLGMVDDATTFAETHGGGGSKSDLKWGRDEDEDNRAWALRCMRMASRMMKPAIGRKPKR